jgi:malonate transporter
MAVINALGPVFLLVLIGVAFRKIDMPGRDFWPRAERITYFVFFPCLLVRTLANANFSAQELGEVFVVALVLLVILAGLLLVFASRLASNAPAFTSVFQGSIRFNTYVGLAAAASLWGDKGLAATVIVVASMVPLVNLLCITIFAIKVGSDTSVARHVAFNPLILACAAGIALNLSGIGLPGWSDPLLEILARPALPLGLLAIGAGLSFAGFRLVVWPVLCSSIVKLLLAPALAFALCLLFGLVSPYREAVILIAALPTAPSAYILSRQLGGDSSLMATITTLQTVLAIGTVPLALSLLTT